LALVLSLLELGRGLGAALLKLGWGSGAALLELLELELDVVQGQLQMLRGPGQLQELDELLPELVQGRGQLLEEVLEQLLKLVLGRGQLLE
jgi:hypothetical protein